ncbi:MAG: phage portal protein [Burkholderiales bacterium]
MGLGTLLRNIVVTQEDTLTGQVITDTIVTGPGPGGSWPDWHGRGTYDGGMGHPGAWRAALLISDLLGSLPWHAYTDGPDGVPVRRTPAPALLQRPAGREPRINTYSSWALDYLWHGNAIGVVTATDASGEAVAALPVPARQVHAKIIEPSDNLSTIPVGSPGYLIGRRWYHPDNVLHVKGPCEPGAVRGMGVLENHLRTLQLAEDQDRQAGASTGAGIPTGVLNVESPDVEEDEIIAAKAKWKTAQATRDVAVLTPAIRFEPLAWNPTDAQLLESRKFTRQDWALIFGVPARYLLAEDSSRTYSNIETEGIELLRYYMNGHVARFEQALEAHLRPGTTVKANLDAVLRADTLTRYQAHEIGIRAGFLLDDEARAYENRPPLTSAQRAQLKAAKAAAAPKPPASGGPDDEPDDDEQEDDA